MKRIDGDWILDQMDEVVDVLDDFCDGTDPRVVRKVHRCISAVQTASRMLRAARKVSVTPETDDAALADQLEAAAVGCDSALLEVAALRLRRRTSR
jgi:hypothetical protein